MYLWLRDVRIELRVHLTTKQFYTSTVFYHADRGQAYVGASRVRSAAGLFYFGRVRRSDWLPVGGPGEPMEHTRRSNESIDSHSDEENDVDEVSSMSEPDDDASEGLHLSDDCDESDDDNQFLSMVPMDGESSDAQHAAAVLSAACFWPTLQFAIYSFLHPSASPSTLPHAGSGFEHSFATQP